MDAMTKSSSPGSDRPRRRIDYAGSVHDEREIEAVVAVLRGGPQALRIGKSVREFERAIAEQFGKRRGVMCNSGSSALYLAVELLGLSPGDEVVTPALTFSTDIAPLVRAGLVPVFVDVEADTYNVDVEAIEAVIRPRTKAILVPNLIGNVPDWDRIRSVANTHGLKLIEDSCDALGSTKGVDRRFFSTIDGDLEYDNLFIFDEVGWNFEPSELSAAFGLVQMEKLADNLAARQRNFRRLFERFGQRPDGFVLPRTTSASPTGGQTSEHRRRDGTGAHPPVQSQSERGRHRVHLDDRRSRSRVMPRCARLAFPSVALIGATCAGSCLTGCGGLR